jgi:hypothetical protein
MLDSPGGSIMEHRDALDLCHQDRGFGSAIAGAASADGVRIPSTARHNAAAVSTSAEF